MSLISSKYISSFQNKEASLDKIHIELLYQLAISNRFHKILEVGSHHGASTSAWLQALDNGSEFNLDICDIYITSTIKKMVGSCSKKKNINLYECKSIELIDSSYDLIFLDGNHCFSCVAEELLQIIKFKIPNIIAHDTNVVNEWPETWESCGGAFLLGQVLKDSKIYKVLEDKKKRKGMLTERGLLLATKKQEIFNFVFEEISSLN